MPVLRANTGEPIFFVTGRDLSYTFRKPHLKEDSTHAGTLRSTAVDISSRLQAFKPQISKVYFNFLEGFNPGLVFFRKAPEQRPSAGFESEDVHCPGDGIDEPGMLD